MNRTYVIRLDDFDIGQAFDGLEVRAEAWEKTASYLRDGQLPGEEFFMIEECNGPEEADRLAEHYRSIIRKIRQQMKEQP